MVTVTRPALSGLELSALSTALERVASWVRRATPRGEFSGAALATLAALVVDGPQRISDLVLRERITQPGMTSLVSRLADAGLAERRPDPADGRASLVAATEAGRLYIDTVHRRRAEIIAVHLQRLPPHLQQTLAAATEGIDALSDEPIDTEGRAATEGRLS